MGVDFGQRNLLATVVGVADVLPVAVACETLEAQDVGAVGQTRDVLVHVEVGLEELLALGVGALDVAACVGASFDGPAFGGVFREARVDDEGGHVCPVVFYGFYDVLHVQREVGGAQFGQCGILIKVDGAGIADVEALVLSFEDGVEQCVAHEVGLVFFLGQEFPHCPCRAAHSR